MKLVTWSLRIGLAALFVYAGVMKLRDPTAFAIEIGNYRIFPDFSQYLAIVLPTVEIALGLGLVALPSAWRRAAALGVAGLLAMFTVAVTAAVVRGINIDCGCFGGDSGPVTRLTILRNVVLLALAVTLVVTSRNREPT